MAKVYVITSGKGGVGKTTSTANIGSALAKLGKKVVVIDSDIGLRNLDVVLGLENRIVFDLIDVSKGVCDVEKALIKDRKNDGLYLLPASQTSDKEALEKKEMIRLVNELKEDFDYILIDCPAGIERGFKNAIAAADKGIVVTTPEVSAVRDADRIIGLLEAHDVREPELIINMIKMDMVKRGDMLSINDITDILAVDLLGVVPDDEAVVISTNKGQPVIKNPESISGKTFMNIARRMDGQEIPLIDLENKNGLMEKVMKIFRFSK
jgi:septum site-determining protein MinD